MLNLVVISSNFWAAAKPQSWKLFNPAWHSSIFWYTLVSIDTVNCTKIYRTKQCLNPVRILINRYALVLHHTCIDDTTQLMSAFNHAPVSINTTILLRAVNWDNIDIFAHFCGTDKPQSWYIMEQRATALWELPIIHWCQLTPSFEMLLIWNRWLISLAFEGLISPGIDLYKS
jgi:hypothetical protein